MRIYREDTAALLIDMQERLAPVIDKAPERIAAASRLIRGLQALNVPVIPVRQYPRGLGDLVPELRDLFSPYEPSDKVTFSAWETPEIAERIKSLGKKNIIVFGMEAHICVLQTIVDLEANGYNVVFVADCSGSRREEDRDIAFRRAERDGVILTTSESILFEMLREAGSDAFKTISALAKEA